RSARLVLVRPRERSAPRARRATPAPSSAERSSAATCRCGGHCPPGSATSTCARDGLLSKEPPMKWVTRERPKTDRIACPWLIQNFIDKDAEFLYVPAVQVLDVAEREGAHSYDAPNAEYTHRDGLCSFEVLVEEYKLDDPALKLLARIVHGA